MMKTTVIKGRFAGETRSRAVLLGGGRILDIDFHEQIPAGAEVFDFGSGLILPGFIDPHLHGGGGYDFIDGTAESFREIIALHRAHGTTALCPTLTASDWAKTVEFLALCSGMKETPGFVGVHLEGPFLSPQMSGAQNSSCLRVPSPDKAAELAVYTCIIKRITVAPELEGTREFVGLLKPLGISFSIGHSTADAALAYEAISWGFDQVTHLYCATSQRYKQGSYVLGGLNEATLTDDRLTAELIGDGHHISRENFLLALRCKGPEGLCVVSDAMRAAGLPSSETESFLGEIKPENRVILEDGVAKLPDRSSFAGSITLGDRMFSVLCGRYGLKERDVSRMMSETPARMLGIDRERGTLDVGKIADITVLNGDYSVNTVFLAGERT